MKPTRIIPTPPKPRVIDSVLDRMPDDVVASFTQTQIEHLHSALGVRSWKKHDIDLRSTFSIPFTSVKIYYVFLVGKNKRDLSRREVHISAITSLFITVTFLSFSFLVGLVMLYLLKSALGINLFDGFSLGLWDWFKNSF